MTKLNFAPVPLRALRDDELTGLDHRVLGIIAVRVRMGIPTDQGTMAGDIGCNYSRFSTSVKVLLGRGYIERERTGKSWIYRVIYNDADRDVLPKRKTVCQPAKCPEQNSLPKQAEQFAEPPRNLLIGFEGTPAIESRYSLADGQSVSPLGGGTRAPNGADLITAIREKEEIVAYTIEWLRSMEGRPLTPDEREEVADTENMLRTLQRQLDQMRSQCQQ